MSAFNGHGWRRPEEPQCEATHEARPMFRKAVRCERRAGHKDWHCCDDASWAPEVKP